MKKKILFVHTLYYPNIIGGAEIMLQEQAEGLREKGYKVAVLATKEKGTLSIDYINGVKVYRAGIKNIYWHFSNKKPHKYVRIIWHLIDRYNRLMNKDVKKVLELENPDVVVCHNVTGFSVSCFDQIACLKIPIIQVLHDQYYLCANSNMYKKGQACEQQCISCKLLRLGHKNKTSKVSTVIGVSNYILNRFLKFEYFNTAKPLCIYNAREIVAPPKKEDWDGVRELSFGYIGNLAESKGVEFLINQFNMLNINTTLTIAGKGQLEYENHLKDVSKSNKKIKFIGFVDSNVFYSQVDVVVMPSLWPDTFPGVAYEACANHIPVIASNIGGLPEMIKDGVNGLLFEVEKENALQEAILNIYNNPSLFNRLSSNARKSVENLLSIDRMLKQYELAIESVDEK